IARLPGFRFFGNVTFGTDISHLEYKQFYDCIVYAVGAETDRHMNIPGEELEGSFSATEFVGWYNGHPDYLHKTFDLSAENIAVIGMGNVAIDAARILAKTADELADSDIADYALEALKHNKVKDIYLIARRGPVQAAFSPQELKELLELEMADVSIDPDALDLDSASEDALKSADKNTADNVCIMRNIHIDPDLSKPRRLHLMFLHSPVELYEKDSKVSGIKLVKNKLELGANGRISSKATEETIDLPVGLVFRSIGYRGRSLPDVPFDTDKAIIPNVCGRVTDLDHDKVIPGEYVIGWAKRGPSGVIGTNKPDAVETTSLLLKDFSENTVDELDDNLKPEAIEAYLKSKNIDYVTFKDWKLLDKYEVEIGHQHGKPREKVTTVKEMLAIIKEQRARQT
ncbi:MAG: NADP oxidoreductase, partial [Lentisphaeria bacterium]|nr:NADP oxidoreductase [Lentisphaeria bacterium]